MKKILAWIMGLVIMATPASAFWAEDEYLSDPRPNAVVKNHSKYGGTNFTITDIWIDESGYIIFVDYGKDGTEDKAHVHQVIFYLESGEPVIVCRGDMNPKEARKHINEYIKQHSAKGDNVNEKAISKPSSSGDDLGRLCRIADQRGQLNV